MARQSGFVEGMFPGSTDRIFSFPETGAAQCVLEAADYIRERRERGYRVIVTNMGLQVSPRQPMWFIDVKVTP